MFSSRAAFATLAVLCIAAAGAGGYFATRQSALPTPAAAMAVTPPAEARTPSRPGQAPDPAEAAPATAARAIAATPVAAAPGPTVVTGKRSEPARTAGTPARSATGVNQRQDPPVPERPLPASAATPLPPAVPAPTQAASDSSATSVRPDERTVQEPLVAPGPPEKTLEELVVSANSVIGLQTESRISSETARVEDRVEAKVTRDVRVANKIAIPAGSRVVGSVILVERGGKVKDRARIGIRFTTLVLTDGTRLPMSTETIFRDGEDPGNGSAAKIGGGAIVGTILGAIIGGSKGAAIGAAAGASGGVVAVETGDRNAVTLPAGSPLTVRLLAPLPVIIEEK